MDILRKELEEIYASQNLDSEFLPSEVVRQVCDIADNIVKVSNGCAVITDAASDKCHVFSGCFGTLMGYETDAPTFFEADSSDEDVIYDLIHPEDLVDKRLLEFEFFKFANKSSSTEKMSFIAKCSIRMKDAEGIYRLIDNTTQIIALSPRGKIWLILCTYSLSAQTPPSDGIVPHIINTRNGEIQSLTFKSKRLQILSPREKEILMLIREGMPSKIIADTLGISVHTVNRHRQNILEKLSVGNSIEAVTAATLMKLF